MRHACTTITYVYKYDCEKDQYRLEVSQREGVTFAGADVAERPLYERFGTYLGVLCEVVVWGMFRQREAGEL